MFTRITQYFDDTIMPMIHSRYPDVCSQMSIMILGSVGLGIDDELSDMEAAIYLDDPLWHRDGARLQLSLNECLGRTNPWQKRGSIICVHPLSWLLDGQANTVLQANGEDLPWELVSIPSLFTMQENLTSYDPLGTLAHLREVTAPTRCPEPIWRKLLLSKLRQLVTEDYSEFRRSANRDLWAEAHIALGPVLKGLLEVALLLDHRYYPWRTHLRWAFDRSPLSKRFGSDMDQVEAADSWTERIDVIGSLIDKYKHYIEEHTLLPGIDLESDDLESELLWAERLSAWKDPNWRDSVNRWAEKARQNGYPPSDFWIWSLWGL